MIGGQRGRSKRTKRWQQEQEDKVVTGGQRGRSKRMKRRQQEQEEAEAAAAVAGEGG